MAKVTADESLRKISIPSNVKPSNVFARANVVSTMSIFIFNYNLGVMSKALLLMEDDFPSVRNNSFLKGTILKVVLLGFILGYLTGRRLNDHYGLRKTILAADVISALGAAFMGFAPSPYLVISGQLVLGFSVSLAAFTGVSYVEETLSKEVASGFMTTYGLMMIGGQLLSFLVEFALTEVSGAWRWMLLISGVPALLQFCCMLFLPESPNWLAKEKLRSTSEATKDRPTV